MRVALALVLTLATSVRARGQRPTMSADEDCARSAFAEGERAYAARDYRVAVSRFEAARRCMPLPALDHNLGRAHDRLGDTAEALSAYQRYLAAEPAASNAAEVRARIEILRGRLAVDEAPRPAPAESPSASPGSRRWIAPGAVLGAAVIVAAAGAGLLGGAARRFDALDAGCAQLGACTHAQVDAVRGLDYSGKVLLGAGAVLLVVDIGLWVRGARR